MADRLLNLLADQAGIITEWTDALGQPRSVSPEVQRYLLESLGYPARSEKQIHQSMQELMHTGSLPTLPRLITGDEGSSLYLGDAVSTGTQFRITMTSANSAGEASEETVEGKLDQHLALPSLQPGYHLLEINNRQYTLAIAPRACPDLDRLCGQQNARLWGLAAQLYSLRRPGAFGIGDTGALEDLAKSAAALGADALAISPVHAVSSGGFQDFSPYSPSSRLFLNVFHSAPDLILGQDAFDRAIDRCGLRDTLQRLEALELMDWAAVHAAHSTLLRQLYRDFSATPQALTSDFNRFVKEGGVALEDHCRFEAIHEHRLGQHLDGDWRTWPQGLQDPRHPDVAEFAVDNREDIGFHAFCQWLAARSLQRAQHTAREAGMRLGLISDLAVGANIGGSQTWARQAEFLSGLGVGAPPDIINTRGQNWQLSAFSPKGLREHGFRAYIEMLRANLSYCGGVRIDHVMGLERLWLVPEAAEADQGAYVKYPFQDMLRLLTLEAWRHRTLVIGEDLGTVRPGFRDELSQRNILGMRVLFFEQQEQRFRPSQQWPENTMATTTTHDLPTLQGWFTGRDIHWRTEAGHQSQDTARTQYDQRLEEIDALTERLQHEGYLNHDGHEHSPTAMLDASISFVAATPARLAMIPMEDLMASTEQPNLPGPGHIHPNWRRRWPMAAGQMFNTEEIRQRTQRVNVARTQSKEACHD